MIHTEEATKIGLRGGDPDINSKEENWEKSCKFGRLTQLIYNRPHRVAKILIKTCNRAEKITKNKVSLGKTYLYYQKLYEFKVKEFSGIAD